MNAFETSQIGYHRLRGHFSFRYLSTYPSCGSELLLTLETYQVDGCFTNCSLVELTEFYLCVSMFTEECH